jgi:hypothetical protein
LQYTHTHTQVYRHMYTHTHTHTYTRRKVSTYLLGGFVEGSLTPAPCLFSCQVPKHATSSCFLQAGLCVLTSHMRLLVNIEWCQEVRN